MKKSVITAQYAKYGRESFFIFDSDAWKDRVFISDPEKALSFLNKLTKRKSVPNDRYITICDYDKVVARYSK